MLRIYAYLVHNCAIMSSFNNGSSCFVISLYKIFIKYLRTLFVFF